MCWHVLNVKKQERLGLASSLSWGGQRVGGHFRWVVVVVGGRVDGWGNHHMKELYLLNTETESNALKEDYKLLVRQEH